MKAVLQRVKQAKVSVDGGTSGEISLGMLIFISVAKRDDESQADFMAKKVIELRIFEDKDGKMNLSAQDVGAQILVVSQFTLHGDCQKGRRPSFDKAADPKGAEDLYNYFVEKLKESNLKVETGQFRAMMDVSLINSGPVTFVIDSPSEFSSRKS